MTVEQQRQIAKELVKYFEDKQYEASVQAQRITASVLSSLPHTAPAKYQARVVAITSNSPYICARRALRDPLEGGGNMPVTVTNRAREEGICP
eukprot:1191335-Prorocentrum_minimum.AAC.2